MTDKKIDNWDYLAKVPDHMTHYKREFGMFAGLWKKKVKVELLKIVNLEGKMTAEVGCGSGFFGEIAKENGVTIDYGFDITSTLVRASEGKYKHVAVGSSDQLPLESNTVDVIFLPEVIAYVNQKLTFIECNRVLKSGGYVILTVPTNIIMEPNVLFDVVHDYKVFFGSGFRRIMVLKRW